MARRISLRAAPVPLPPISPSHAYLFLDEADGHIKTIDHDGDIVDLESVAGGGGSVTADQQAALDATPELDADHPLLTVEP